ncbi:MAG: alpha/beta hydrolase [Gaiellaceae bacterium]
MIRKTLLALVAALTLAVPAATAAPTVLTGELNGAPYRVVVPENWNGKLVVYAHGYRDLADQPGQVDDRAAEVAPVAALEPVLTGMGYAIAGSAYKRNGWAVQEGVEDTVALASWFRDNVGKPTRTLLWGFSMGSVVTFEIAERTAGQFDGYLAACAVGAGTPRAWDGAGALTAAYDAAFGWPASWGTPADVNDNLWFDAQVFPKLLAEIGNPLNWGKFEFMRLVTGSSPSAVPAPAPTWAFTNMFFATEARAELERRAGGPVVQNLTHEYTLSAGDKGYLALLGVDADALLAEMNAGRTVSAPPFSRNYLEHWADYSGKIKKPLLTLHTQTDALVPASHESAYAATVAAAGRSGLLAQTFTSGNGHCAFSGEQLLTALGALDQWVATGQKPGAASFPAALGFLPGFTPPAWPQQ